LRVLAKLAEEPRVIISLHATLKCLRGVGSVKEPRRDAQSADPVASKPSGTNLVCLTTHFVNQRR
jgi:hypothetical protein